MNNTYLSFIVSNELFAVNVTKVLEVLQNEKITVVPNAPEYVKGIINFRGEIVPVFESRSKFNFSERQINDPYVIIVFDLPANNEAFRVGTLVDKVKDVISINDTEIKPVPTLGKDFNSDFLLGIFKLRDDFILILDIDKVFNIIETSKLKELQVDDGKTVN